MRLVHRGRHTATGSRGALPGLRCPREGLHAARRQAVRMGARGDGAITTETLARERGQVEVHAWLPLFLRGVQALPAGSRRPECKGWAEHAIPREDTDLPHSPNNKTPSTNAATREGHGSRGGGGASRVARSRRSRGRRRRPQRWLRWRRWRR